MYLCCIVASVGPVAAAKSSVEALRQHGIECPVVTGAGTGTFPFEIEGMVHTELQPGSFLFMDNDYAVSLV